MITVLKILGIIILSIIALRCILWLTIAVFEMIEQIRFYRDTHSR